MSLPSKIRASAIFGTVGASVLVVSALRLKVLLPFICDFAAALLTGLFLLGFCLVSGFDPASRAVEFNEKVSEE